MDSRSGRDGTLVAEVDADRGGSTGTCQRFDPASGEPSTGDGSGIPLGPDDGVPELFPD